MTPNDELLARTLRHIIENPREWDQESWAHRWEDEDKLGRDVCGTAYCFAGTAVVLTGHPILWEGDHAFSDLVVDGDGVEEVPGVARRELGLSADDAEWLFHPENSLTNLCDIVRQITDGRVDITPPAELADATSGSAG